MFFSLAAFFAALFFALIAAGTVIFMLYGTIIGFAMGAPYVRSRKEKTELMIDFAFIGTDDAVVDLGSGDGSLVIAAVRAGARAAVGVEMNPLLVWYSRVRIWHAGLGNRAKIVRGNFYDFSLANSDVVLMYLWPSTVEKLGAKMRRELKSGSRVVSSAFPIPGWIPAREENGIFLYRP